LAHISFVALGVSVITVHLRELVEERRRVFDVEPDPSGQEWSEAIFVADDDQSTGSGKDAVVDALSQRRARRHHL
jgi:hypothetical protein